MKFIVMEKSRNNKTTRYEDAGLQANTKYNYTIKATDAAGNKSKVAMKFQLQQRKRIQNK